MGLSEEERREIESMRDTLVARMEQLDDELSFGRITDAERHRALAHEFGHDYAQSLRDMNLLLHARTSPLPVPHARLGVLTASVVAALALVLGAFALAGQAPIAAAIADPIELGHGQTLRLAIDEPMTVQAVDARHSGQGEFELILHDRAAAHTLLEGEGDAMECVGCGAHYAPPYMLEFRSAGGTLIIDEVRTR